MTDDAKGKHEERMQALRERPWRRDSYRIVFNEALTYADELAAERDELATKHKIVCECVKVVDGANESLRRQLWAADEKLQAAERVILRARNWVESEYRQEDRATVTIEDELADAVSAYDSLATTGGSTGGAGEGVG